QVDRDEIATEKGTVVSVTDGDTVRVIINGENIPIRLIGIDTPEINHPSEPVQCYGPEAKTALANLILNKEVTLEKDVSDTDVYDRYLRYIWFDEILVNEYMTQNGYAFASPYPPDTKYQNRINAGETIAKNSYAGLWATNTCNGNVYTGTYKDPNKVTDHPATETYTNTNTTTTQQPAYVAPVVPAPTPTSSYTCNCSKTCPNMASCDEAYYQLNTCGCSARDGDKDGVPCESICK
ncbi:MAG: thermonuclease family protein, partial [Patescibacteria group bacterium]